MRCSKCGREAIIKLSYANLRLCKDHFIEYVEGKVLKTIRRYGLIKPGDLVLAAVSGGKDSIAMAHILNRLREKLNYKLHLLHIDLGLGAYSKSCRDAVVKLANAINAPLTIIKINEILDTSLPMLARRSRRPICSVCGLIKRYIMNAAAIELKASSIATGHNLDDITMYAFKEFINQNLEAISKLTPRLEGVSDIAVARIKPLYEVYEFETLNYVKLLGINFVEEKCPYYDQWTLDIRIKVKLGELETQFPGLKIGFVRKMLKNMDKYPKYTGEYNKCRICGLVSSAEICAYCRLTEKILGKPMGLETRRRVRALIKEGLRTLADD